VYQDNKSTLAMVTAGGGKPRTKYMKVREECIKERLKTWEVALQYVSTKQMLADLLTKPLGGELYHNLTHKLLGGHQYECLNNRGAKGVRDFYEKHSASVKNVAPALAELSCSTIRICQCIKNILPMKRKTEEINSREHDLIAKVSA
jgi:hypothetical protein